MESSGSSFIPTRPTRGKVAAKSFRKVYVLSYVSYLVFFTTLLAAGGIYLYILSLKSELSSLQQDLVAQKNLFSQSDLDRVRNLDYRIDTANDLVNGHASLLTVFNALDSVIADPVQFLSFNYDRVEDTQRPHISLTAVAEEFDEVIFQDQIMRNNAITSRFNVANVNLSTQPIDPERLELGVRQVVNVNLTAELAVSDINFTGFVSAGDDNLIINSDEPNVDAGLVGDQDTADIDNGSAGDDVIDEIVEEPVVESDSLGNSDEPITSDSSDNQF